MAIYSLNHRSVGKKTHAPRTAGAHVRYITRPAAVGRVMAEHMPSGPGPARAWFDAQELSDRANARIADKIMVALPLELNAEERVQLVRDFAHEVTLGRTPWLAAIHDRGKDARNPHAHIMIRDRDVTTGKRAIGLSEKGSTDRLREAWEQAANRALAQAGSAARIDRRTLDAQGIDAEPGIHVGHTGPAMAAQGLRPESAVREGSDGRIIDYPAIDAGRTRAEANAEIAAANLARQQALEAVQAAEQAEATARAEQARQEATQRLAEDAKADRRRMELAEQQARQAALDAAALAARQGAEREEFARYYAAGRRRAAVEAEASVPPVPRARGLVALFRWITGRDRRDRAQQERERHRRIAEALRRHAVREQEQRALLERRQEAERAALPERQVERGQERDHERGPDPGEMEI